MRRILLCFLLLIPAVIRLEADVPLYAVAVSLWSVPGSSDSLTSGMHVDARFFLRGRDGKPLTSGEAILVLRNVEIGSNLPSANSGGENPNVASLLLTQSQVLAVRALPPTVVQLVSHDLPEHAQSTGSRAAGELRPPGNAIPRDLRKPADSRAGSYSERMSDTHTARTEPAYAYTPPDWQIPEDNYYSGAGISSKSLLGVVLSYVVWLAAGLLVLITLAGTMRSAKRCRKSLRGKTVLRY
jgi:hypothetical protein